MSIYPMTTRGSSALCEPFERHYPEQSCGESAIPNRSKSMELRLMKIPARSRRQALDWSLVLVSQGIESTIDPGEDGSHWGLLVSAADYDSAVHSIRLYRIENRGWPWRREIFHRGVIFDWGSLAWVALLGLFFVLDARLNLREAGVMNTASVSRGQWWRLFTGV